MNDKKKLGIYVHIPFCIRKCLYCDFLSDTADINVRKQYIEALINEICSCPLKDIDYKSQYTFDKTGGFANLLAPFFCKGKYFEQEKELRLIYNNYEIDERNKIEGVQFKVSLDTLIDEIWIAPVARTWFEEIVKKELILHNIHKQVNRSCINAR